MSRIEIREAALRSNIEQIAKIAPIEKIYAVLKDNAYGHGLREFALLCSKHGIAKAVVRNMDEATVIADIFADILCLAEQTNFQPSENISFAVNSIDTLSKIPSGTKIHLKVDSGMHRCGVNESELGQALEYAASNGIKLCGVFSHLKSADELSSESFWQEKNFIRMRKFVLDFCAARGFEKPIFHLQNSAGLFRSGGLGIFDAARVGIALYGYLDMPKALNMQPLAPVASLWANKIASRGLDIGARVGYGGIGKVSAPAVVSVYDIGYADGFPRSKPYADYLLPCGKPLTGRVSMDNICVEGAEDSICVFDNAAKMAASYGTISYDILTRLNPKIKRVIV